MTTAIFYFGLILFLTSTETSIAVDIKKLTVPPMYVLGSVSSKPLILDCEYDISPNETGLVVKWLLNEINIYQWIPNQKPFSLGPMKKHIDTSYSLSFNKYDKYRAMSIVNPKWDMTGNYTCSVQTFQGMSQQTAPLKIIHPERDFNLHTQVDVERSDIEVTCRVDDIFPPPHLAILINGEQLSIDITAEKDKKGPFDVKATSKKPLIEIELPATITCDLTIPGTDYTKRKEIIYTAPTQSVEILEHDAMIDEDSTDTLSRLESASNNLENKSNSLYPYVLVTTFVVGMAVFHF